MKSLIKQDFVIVSIKATRNDDYKIIKLGSTDFSGTTSFLVDTEIVKDLEERDLVYVEFFIQFALERNDKNEYVEIIKNKRLLKVLKK